MMHKTQQEMPWPPYSEATFMYTKWKCLVCDWQSGTVMDTRGNPHLETARESAKDHERQSDDH